MKRFYLATIIAIVITTSIAAHLLAVGVLGPVTPGYLARIRQGVSALLRRAKILFDDRVAAALRRGTAALDPVGRGPRRRGTGQDGAVVAGADRGPR